MDALKALAQAQLRKPSTVGDKTLMGEDRRRSESLGGMSA
jgi:hypothetical protein